MVYIRTPDRQKLAHAPLLSDVHYSTRIVYITHYYDYDANLPITCDNYLLLKSSSNDKYNNNVRDTFFASFYIFNIRMVFFLIFINWTAATIYRLYCE